VKVQEVRWDSGGAKPAGEHIFYRKRNENHELGTGFSVQRKIIISAVKTIEFVSHDTKKSLMRYHCSEYSCPTEYKNDMKSSF
jgi:hypothetical protein